MKLDCRTPRSARDARLPATSVPRTGELRPISLPGLSNGQAVSQRRSGQSHQPGDYLCLIRTLLWIHEGWIQANCYVTTHDLRAHQNSLCAKLDDQLAAKIADVASAESLRMAVCSTRTPIAVALPNMAAMKAEQHQGSSGSDPCKNPNQGGFANERRDDQCAS